MVSLVSRFRSYVKVIGEREFCDLGELATRTGRDLKKILKDVEKNDWQRMVQARASG